MSHREVELLAGRALRMLKSAQSALLAGHYDIAAFMADQAFQLHLKSTILDLTGEIPRVHSIRQLLHILGTAVTKLDEIDRFIRNNRSLLVRLEDSYITSRYIPREYEREEADELVEFAKEAIEFVKDLRGKA